MSQNLYIFTLNMDSFKKYSNNFQDPTRELIVEFVYWCPYFESVLPIFAQTIGTEQNCIIRILLYSSHISQISLMKPPKTSKS